MSGFSRALASTGAPEDAAVTSAILAAHRNKKPIILISYSIFILSTCKGTNTVELIQINENPGCTENNSEIKRHLFQRRLPLRGSIVDDDAEVSIRFAASDSAAGPL